MKKRHRELVNKKERNRQVVRNIEHKKKDVLDTIQAVKEVRGEKQKAYIEEYGYLAEEKVVKTRRKRRVRK